MKYLLFLLLFTFTTITAFAQANTWGLGIRLGSPTALTLKRYIGTRHALDINVGNGPWGFSENGYGAYRNNGVSVMINYLLRRQINDAPGLEFYYGIGGMISARSYYYDKRERYRTRGGLGVTGAIGLEYKIKGEPLAFFLEANPYVELIPAPFWVNLGVGIGGRYIF